MLSAAIEGRFGGGRVGTEPLPSALVACRSHVVLALSLSAVSIRHVRHARVVQATKSSTTPSKRTMSQDDIFDGNGLEVVKSAQNE